MKLLATLNPSKACGPDEIPNWLLKEYAELLAFPVSKIINSSFKEQRLPKIWKLADVSPLPKVKPVEDLKKHLRPISLTPRLSKVAEECVVVDYVKSAVLNFLDLSQHGAVPKSSTTQALIHILQKDIDHLFKAIVLPKITYGLPVFGASTSDLNAVQCFLKRYHKRQYVSELIDIHDLLEKADRTLFEKIGNDENHPLYTLLPKRHS